MRLLVVILTLTIWAFQASAAELPTALKALRTLPKGESKQLARIEGHGGAPVPERWHFLVHDKKSESGVHEYVVANGELVASRDVSQFAESLSKNDVIGSAAVKIDSNRVAKLAEEFAMVNTVTIASMNFALLKEGAEATPVWKVTCMDASGANLGTLVVTAGKGKVVSHEGFATAPVKIKKTSAKSSKLKTQAMPEVGVEIEALDAMDVEPDAVGQFAAANLETAAAPEGETPARYEDEGRAFGGDAAVTSANGERNTADASSAVVQRSEPEARRRRSSTRSSIRVPSPPRIVRHATRPVRKIIRRVLPF